MTQVHDTIEATVSAAASKVTWTGSAVTVVSSITSSDVGLWAGIAIGVAGLVINWIFKYRSDRRSEEAHVAFMSKLHLGSEAVPAHAFIEEKDEA